LGAQTDTYEVWEVRRQWRYFHQQVSVLMETLERWRESLAGTRELELSRLLPNLDTVCQQIDQRWEQVERMLAGKVPIGVPQPEALLIDRHLSQELSHFEKAALSVTKAQIDRLSVISQSLFECVQDIKGFSYSFSISQHIRHFWEPTLDPARLAAALQVVLTFCAAFLIWVYIDPPGHAMFVFFATLISLVAAMAHQSPSIMLLPFVYGSLVAGILYVFVMPHLSGYAQLGWMIFGVTFGYYFLFWQPKQALIKVVGTACFLVHTGIDNQQSYSFAAYANSTAMMILGAALATASSYVLASPRPEKQFQHLMARFFRHSEFLLSRLALDREVHQGLKTRCQMALYRNDLLEIPAKLAALGQRIDYRLLSGQTLAQVQTLIASLQSIAYRIKALGDLRELPQSKYLVTAMLEELRAWRLTAQQRLRLWAEDPATGGSQVNGIRDRMLQRMSKLEEQMSETLRNVPKEHVSDKEVEHFYCLLGAFKGLSESGIACAQAAEAIDWKHWQEAKF
jgi:hypothetical protein